MTERSTTVPDAALSDDPPHCVRRRFLWLRWGLDGFREAQLIQQSVEQLFHEGLLCTQQFLDPRLLRCGLDTSRCSPH
ncbi:hypothetical protein QFZ68_000249 [Streptomyces sp. V1I6]|nr:hypothetical protein [Streptomyces sp. V1I6]